MKPFLNQILILSLPLFALAGMAEASLDSFNFKYACIGIAMMAFNAIFAVYPLHRFPRLNFLHVYLGSMLIRLLLLGAAFILLLSGTHVSWSDSLSLVLSSLASFVVYQGVEIRHMLKSRDLAQPVP